MVLKEFLELCVPFQDWNNFPFQYLCIFLILFPVPPPLRLPLNFDPLPLCILDNTGDGTDYTDLQHTSIMIGAFVGAVCLLSICWLIAMARKRQSDVPSEGRLHRIISVHSPGKIEGLEGDRDGTMGGSRLRLVSTSIQQRLVLEFHEYCSCALVSNLPNNDSDWPVTLRRVSRLVVPRSVLSCVSPDTLKCSRVWFHVYYRAHHF